MADEHLTLDTLRGSGTSLLAKMALAKLSEDLVASPTLRAAFVKDPTGFIRSRFGHEVAANERNYFSTLARMYEDGNCCGGCSCPPPGSGCGVLRTPSLEEQIGRS